MWDMGGNASTLGLTKFRKTRIRVPVGYEVIERGSGTGSTPICSTHSQISINNFLILIIIKEGVKQDKILNLYS